MAGKPFRRKGSKEWYVIIEGTPDPETGARRQRWLHAPTRKAVLELQTKALRERDTGSAIDPTKLTVAEFAAHYMATIARPTMRATVVQVRAQNLRVHILPHLGALPLQKLAPHHLTAWHAHLATMLSANTIRSIHGQLRTMLGRAVREQFIARNVAGLVAPPRATERAATVWDLAQVRVFLAGLDPADPRELLFATAIETGLRTSELVGLRWGDVDLAVGALGVTRALVRLRGNEYADNAPKSASSRRRVPLLPQTTARLAAHRQRQGDARRAAGAAWRETGAVFAWHDGGPVKPSTLYHHWGRTVARLGLPYIRPHDCRHAHATLLLGLNVHPRIVQERLGHSSPAMTMRVYSHVLAGMQEEALGKLAAALNPAPVGDPQG